ncbi:MAG: NADH-quinone oxidoreductase subunit H [Anaerolineales bacterium]
MSQINLIQVLIAFLIFPGLLFALPMGWMMMWLERKSLARMQGRIGPPFFQPFFDFIKLMAKRPIARLQWESNIYTGLALLAVGANLGALTLLPIFLNPSAEVGDLILFVALAEIAPICWILAGFASRSIFGQVGAVREATLTIASNLPFITALIALASAAKSLQMSELVTQPALPVRLLGLLALLICLPVRLRLNPFSLPNAEQEIYSGAVTEFDGARLALWELAHALEWVMLSGLVICLACPWRSALWWVNVLLFGLGCLLMAILLTTFAAATARLKISQASNLFWRWGFGVSLLALIVALIPLGV